MTTVRDGRTRRDTRYLLAHLSRQDNQRSRVIEIAAPVVTDEAAALDYMSALRDGSRATVAFHHLSLSPSQPLTHEQRDEAVARVLSALGAEDHARVVWEHAGKGRRVATWTCTIISSSRTWDRAAKPWTTADPTSGWRPPRAAWKPISATV
ncbi:hypothetical protein RFN28_20290 [Mesorhizobium sp. VK24D]|uniref:Relaxase/Mobilisation nuclease domain-containing protein n=1 Tax=Mesorhizobium album TaxID=3072314 RepID=A0ABU4Y3U6_9HYPH|nr:hypothetical protein [Mesorhizobium sp. VK24D]MDX8480785.1 hypothetical protein [Mesorhizobium sp. VK24D]